ncbi:MAG: hypothetical protein ABEN55_21730 [Bradymonadaceae bacterium]
MSYTPDAGYSGWDRWMYPIRVRGASITVKEGSDFSNPNQQDTIDIPDDTYLPTGQAHGGTDLPHTSLYDTLETLLSNAALGNSYSLDPGTLTEHNPGNTSIDIVATSGTDPFQFNLSGFDPGWLGWSEGTTTRDDGGTGTLAGTVSYFGACHLPADQAPDQRGWPRRGHGRSRSDAADGRLRELGRHTRRTVAYRDLGSVDIWPSRVQNQSNNPLYSTTPFDDSPLFAAVLEDINAQFWNLFRFVGLADDCVVVWSTGADDLQVTSHVYEVGVLEVADDIWAHLEETEPREQYDLTFPFLPKTGNRDH